jgi:hypothetical protein
MYEGTDPNTYMYWMVAGNTRPSTPDGRDPVPSGTSIDQLTESSETTSSAEPTIGCTDTAALNYNPLATSGCKNCCTYSQAPAEVVGCMDSGAENYDASANVQCRSCCSYPIHGCMDSEALNYDRTATVQCNSCCKFPDQVLATEEDIDGSGAGYGGGGYGGGIVEPTSEEEGVAPKKKSKKALWIGVGLVALLLLTSKKKK